MSIDVQKVTEAYKKHPIGLTAAIVSVLAIGVIYFRSDLAGELNSRLTEVSAANEKIKNNLLYSSQLPAQYDALVAANAQIRERLVHVNDLAINLQYFYKIEADTGTKIIDLRQLPVPSLPKGAARGTYSSVPYSVAVAGSYEQVLLFLKRVETGSHFCKIVSCSLSPSSSGEAADAKGRLVLSVGLELLGESI